MIYQLNADRAKLAMIYFEGIIQDVGHMIFEFKIPFESHGVQWNADDCVGRPYKNYRVIYVTRIHGTLQLCDIISLPPGMLLYWCLIRKTRVSNSHILTRLGQLTLDFLFLTQYVWKDNSNICHSSIGILRNI